MRETEADINQQTVFLEWYSEPTSTASSSGNQITVEIATISQLLSYGVLSI